MWLCIFSGVLVPTLEVSEEQRKDRTDGLLWGSVSLDVNLGPKQLTGVHSDILRSHWRTFRGGFVSRELCSSFFPWSSNFFPDLLIFTLFLKDAPYNNRASFSAASPLTPCWWPSTSVFLPIKYGEYICLDAKESFTDVSNNCCEATRSSHKPCAFPAGVILAPRGKNECLSGRRDLKNFRYYSRSQNLIP